jgi:hypothetical protein
VIYKNFASKLLRKFLAISTALSIAMPIPAAANIVGDSGQIFYRYKVEAGITPPAPGETQGKDIVAFYVGAVDFGFSERLPMKSEWADDNWRIAPNFELPEGITFDPQTLTFTGKPTTPGTTKVELVGYDELGNQVADAEASFTIHTIVGQPIPVDLYAHTGKYKFDELSIPAGITPDHWEYILGAPPGMTVNGPYFEGVPDKAGTYQVFGYARDYNKDRTDNIVATFFGKYTVEDGPTFTHITDRVSKLPTMIAEGVNSAGLGVAAPASIHINRAIDPSVAPRYFLERAEDGNMPTACLMESTPRADMPYGSNSNDNYKDLRVYGWMPYPYDTVNLRLKAYDSDGTVGCSNWFEFGTSDPQPECSPARPYSLNILTGKEVNIQIPRPKGGNGTLSYRLVSGELPKDITLTAAGILTGTPSIANTVNNITVITDVINGSEVVSTEPCLYTVSVGPGDVKLSDITPPQDQWVRLGQTYNGILGIIGGLAGHDVRFKDPSAYPDYSFVGPTLDANPVHFTGEPKVAGDIAIPFILKNGDGAERPGHAVVHARSDIDVFDEPTVSVKRLDLPAGKAWAQIDYDDMSVIPDAMSPASFPKFELNVIGTALPKGVTFNTATGQFAGGTEAEHTSYGPYRVTMCDFTGDCDQTGPFSVDVVARDEIAGNYAKKSVVFHASMDQEATEETVARKAIKQPALATPYTLKYQLNGSIPSYLSFDDDTAQITAIADIPRSEIGKTTQGLTVTATDNDPLHPSSFTTDPFEVIILDRPEIRGNAGSYAIRNNVAGDTSIGEDDTKVDVPGSIFRGMFTNETLVGGSAALTFVGIEPSRPGGLDFDPSTGVLYGRPSSEFKGSILVKVKDGANRDGAVSVPMEIRPYPVLSVPEETYEIPRLSSARGIGASVTVGSWSGADDWAWNPGTIVDPDLLVKQASAQTATSVVGSPKSPEDTVFDDLIITTEVLNADGKETLTAFSNPFAIRIVSPDPIKMKYQPEEHVFYRDEEGALAGLDAALPQVTGSYVPTLKFRLKDVSDLTTNNVTGIDINPQSGVLFGQPSELGRWTIEAEVKDSDTNPATTPAAVKIFSTLSGRVKIEGQNVIKKLRVDEPFETAPMAYSHYVGSVKFEFDKALDPGLSFDPVDAYFEKGSAFTEPFDPVVYRLGGKDNHDRGLNMTPTFTFTVLPGLEAQLNSATYTARQYQTDESFDLSISTGVKQSIGDITWSVADPVPGTLVNAVYNKDDFLRFEWNSEKNENYTITVKEDGTVDKFEKDRIAQIVPSKSIPTDLMPADALVFDPLSLTLKGTPSKAGSFDIRLTAHDSHGTTYIGKSAGSEKTLNNATTTNAVTLVVEPAYDLKIVNNRDEETVPRYTHTSTITSTSVNAAYGRPVTWTAVSGTLPDGITASKGSRSLGYAGYPDTIGKHDNIVWKAKDYAGRTEVSTAVTLNIVERKDLEVFASMNPVGTIVNEPMADLIVTARYTAYGQPIPTGKWSVSGVSNLPPGISHVINNGSVVFSGTPTLLGKFSGITVTGTDSLGKTDSVTLTINVIESSDPIGLEVSDIVTKAGYPFDMQATATNTYGTVKFYSYDIAGELAREVRLSGSTGYVDGKFSVAGDRDFDVYVTDATNRVTSKPVVLKVLPILNITVPQVVDATQGKSNVQTTTTIYKLGETTFEKGNGVWPDGLSVDKDTGTIRGNPTSKDGLYPGLTIIGTDTFTAVGKIYKDVQSSNDFSIRVKPTEASPFIFDVDLRNDLGAIVQSTMGTTLRINELPFTVGKPASYRPKVSDSVNKNATTHPWNYGGTRYTLNGSLPAGLSLDEKTGEIKGTPTVSGVTKNLSITVTSALGNSSTMANFTLYVVPEDLLSYVTKSPAPLTIHTNTKKQNVDLAAKDQVGKVTYSIGGVSGPARTVTFNGAAMDVTVGAEGTLTLIIVATDEFRRTTSATFAMVAKTLGVSFSFAPPEKDVAYTSSAPTVTNAFGKITYQYTGLPAGLTGDPDTGIVTGKPTAESGMYSVTLTVTDAIDATTASKTVSLGLTDPAGGARYWRLNATAGGSRSANYVSEISFNDIADVNAVQTAQNKGQLSVISNGTTSYLSGLSNNQVYANEVAFCRDASCISNTAGFTFSLTYDFGTSKANPSKILVNEYLSSWSKLGLFFNAQAITVEASDDGVDWKPVNVQISRPYSNWENYLITITIIK